MPTPHDRDRHAAELAQRLLEAEHAAHCLPLPGGGSALSGEGLDFGYAVQAAGRELRLDADRLAGYKIGLTSPESRRGFDAAEPVHGYVLESSCVDDGAELDSSQLIAPRVEVEVAFALAGPVDAEEPTAADVLAVVDHCRLALEIVDSRWCERPPLELLVADDVSAARAVLGPRLAPSAAQWRSVTVHAQVGDRATDGSGAAVLGDPLAAVAWLERALRARGERLDAGQLLLSGTLVAPMAAEPGDAVSAQFTGVGRVGARFSA